MKGFLGSLTSCWSATMQGRCYLIFLLSVRAVFFSTMGLFIKLSTSVGGINATEVVLARAIFQSIFVVAGMAVTTTTTAATLEGPSKPQEEKEEQLLLLQPFGPTRFTQLIVVARGFLGTWNFFLHSYTFHVLPLGDAMTLLSLAPIITIFGAASFLGEPLHRLDLLAACCSVLGSLLIARPEFLFGPINQGVEGSVAHPHQSLGYITGILGACCASSVVMLVRKAGKTGVHTLHLLFSWGAVSVVICAVLIAVFQNGTIIWPTSAKVWYYIFGFCFFGFSANIIMNYAGRLAPATLTSILRSSAIIWSYMYEAVVFGQVPSILTVAGAILVVIAILIATLKKHIDKLGGRQQEEEEEDEAMRKETSNLLDPLEKGQQSNDNIVLPSNYGSTEK